MGSIPNDYGSRIGSEKKYTIAIIGGGIGGLTLAIGLMKHPHIDVHIYESAHAFGEIGAGITVGPNAQRALELIGPGAKAAFDKERTDNLWQSHQNDYTQNIVGYGPRAGEVIASQRNSTGMQCVHRAKFLDALVECIPAYRAHFSKRLVEIEERGEKERLILQFKDGTSAECDAIIGADGIHSAVRKHLLGAEHPATKPTFAGAVSYRGMVSMDRAVEFLGSEIAQNSTMITGPSNAILSYRIDHGETLNVVFMNFDAKNWPHDKWIVPATRKDLEALVGDWGETTQAMIELLDKPELAAWAMFDHPPAPYYAKNRIVMMGDAAHSTTPFQGQGAAQAIEDALVLETLLGKVENPQHISNAFAAYDQVRRPRTQRIVSTSRESGNLLGWQLEGVGDDLDKMREKLKTRMRWIWNRDLVAQNGSALKLMEESIESA